MKFVQSFVLFSFMYLWASLAFAHDYTTYTWESSCPRCYLVGPKYNKSVYRHQIFAHDPGKTTHTRVHNHIHTTITDDCNSCS